MKIGQWIEYASAELRQQGLESPRTDTELLLSNILGGKRVELQLKWDNELGAQDETKANAFLERRKQGEPIAYIVGGKEFYSLNFSVSPGVLIPRPETESLVDLALKKLAMTNKKQLIIDLGCGSGCIGLSILAKCSQAELIGTDISPTAVACSRRNAQRLGLVTRANFYELDLDQAECSTQILKMSKDKEITVVVTNPPYISRDDMEIEEMVKKYEPSQALFADEKGLGAIKRWSKTGLKILSPGGQFLMEIGYKQGKNVFEFLQSLVDFEDIKIEKDLSGKERVICASKKCSEAKNG